MLLGLVAYFYPRLRSGGGQGVLVLATGLFGVTIGVDGVYYARELGLSADDVTGFVSIAAGLALHRASARLDPLALTPRRDSLALPPSRPSTSSASTSG